MVVSQECWKINETAEKESWNHHSDLVNNKWWQQKHHSHKNNRFNYSVSQILCLRTSMSLLTEEATEDNSFHASDRAYPFSLVLNFSESTFLKNDLFSLLQFIQFCVFFSLLSILSTNSPTGIWESLSNHNPPLCNADSQLL